MFCSRTANDTIDKLHDRALKLLYDDYGTLFSDLLAKDGLFIVHHTNIQTMYKQNITYQNVV